VRFIFDHVKHIIRWPIIVMHVYDPLYQRMMILMLCKIKVEDETTQLFVLNEVQHILP